MKTENGIDTIVFDMGGVLVNDILRDLIHLLRKKGYRLHDKKVDHAIRREPWIKYETGKIEGKEYWQSVIGLLELDCSVEELEKFTYENIKKKPGIENILQRLDDFGYKLCILSNNTKEWFYPVLKREKLLHYFDKTLASYEVGLKKPDKEFYDKLNIVYHRAIFCDDMERNTRIFDELGGKSIIVKNTKQLENEFVKLGVLNEN